MPEIMPKGMRRIPWMTALLLLEFAKDLQKEDGECTLGGTPGKRVGVIR
jgi:hypothetical protein